MKQKNNTIIGLDEAGKGEFYGPIVCAGVYFTEKTSEKLLNLIVDSKLIQTKRKIHEIANLIKNETNWFVEIIEPKKYNELYLKYKNHNILLTFGHLNVIKKFSDEKNSNFIIDDFTNKSIKSQNEYFKNVNNNEKLNLEKIKEKIKFETKGEAKYKEIAAASIIAKSIQLNWVDKNIYNKYNINPKSTEIRKLIKTNWKHLNLDEIVKLNFSTIDNLKNSK